MNILTIDLEEWYIYDQYSKGGRNYYLPIINSYLQKILDLLDEQNITATFFCLGIIARNYPEIIRSISIKGHDIGCHSDIHTLLSKQTPAAFKTETRSAFDSLAQVIGKKITMYRAPAFSLTEQTKWALETLIELGAEYDSSIFPANRSFGGFPSFSESSPVVVCTPSGYIKEFPVSFSRFGGKNFIFSGGGYFRLLPYNVIKEMMVKSNYNMAYFHIRDFDCKQKKVYSKRFFQSYFGIKGAYVKFEKLITNFHFISINQASELIEWEMVKRIG